MSPRRAGNLRKKEQAARNGSLRNQKLVSKRRAKSVDCQTSLTLYQRRYTYTYGLETSKEDCHLTLYQRFYGLELETVFLRGFVQRTVPRSIADRTKRNVPLAHLVVASVTRVLTTTPEVMKGTPPWTRRDSTSICHVWTVSVSPPQRNASYPAHQKNVFRRPALEST